VKLKIDENLPSESSKLFRDAQHDAVSVQDQQLGGRPDADIAEACRAEGRILVTLDADFSNIVAYPPAHYPGIVVLRSADQSIPKLLRLVSIVVVALKTEPVERRLWIVEPDRIRVRGA
jgi:predicted nuclease of predicted toxin-antitoxin system